MSLGSLVLVSGEAGIGKTTLVKDLTVRAEDAGCLVLWGHCFDLTVTPPYGPWVELARSYTPTDDLPPFPAFLHGGAALAAVGSQEALFAQTWEFFATLAKQRPLVLVLEDLHWADQESLALLRFLARQIGRHRALVLATYRSDELTQRHALSQLMPLLVREAGAERLSIRPLDDDATRGLITERYPLADTDLARLETYLVEHAEGNPLYAGELLRTLEEERVLVRDGGDWQLGDLERAQVPPLLRQVIEGRLSRLDEESQRLLRVAAVIGQTVPLPVWAAVGAVAEDTLLELAEQAEAARLLAGAADADAVRFSHALIREALYETTPPLRRRRLHRQVGEVLAESRSSDPDAVAHHFVQAGEARAAEWLLQAGERAQRAYAWVTAAERFDAALARLTEQDAPAAERAALLWRIAMLLRWIDTRRAVALMDEAHVLAEEAGECGLASVCRFRAGWLRCLLGDVRAGVAGMEQGVGTFEALDAMEQARCWTLLGYLDSPVGALTLWLAHVGRLEEARSRGMRMVAEVPAPELRQGQGVSGYVDGLAGLAVAEALLGRPDAARQLFSQVHVGYRTIEHFAQLAVADGYELALVQLPYLSHDREGRRRLAEEVEENGRRAQDANAALPARSRAVPLLVVEGAWADARDVASRTYNGTIWRERRVAAPWLALVAREQGDVALARRIVSEVLPHGPGTEPGHTIMWAALPLQLLAAGMALDVGDLPAARSWLAAHDRWLAWYGAVLGRAEGALGWATYHHADDNRSLARQNAKQALTYASQPRQPLALIAAHRFLGMLDTQDRRFADADGHLEQSLALADACAAPFEQALTLVELAGVRAAESKVDDARALLGEVRAICEPLEAKPTLERVAALEVRLGAVRPTYPAGLTAREVEVLRLVAEGLSDAEIADRLYLSPRTVGAHLRSIYNKLDVSSRAAATRFAVERGLT